MSLKTSYCGYVLYEKKKNTPNTRILMVKGYIKQSQTNFNTDCQGLDHQKMNTSPVEQVTTCQTVH